MKHRAEMNLKTLSPGGIQQVIRSSYVIEQMLAGRPIEHFVSGAVLLATHNLSQGLSSYRLGYYDFCTKSLASMSHITAINGLTVTPRGEHFTMPNGMVIPAINRPVELEKAYPMLMVMGAQFPMKPAHIKGIKSILSHDFTQQVYYVLYYVKQDGEVGQSIVGLSTQQKRELGLSTPL